MKKKLLALLMSVGMVFGITAFSGCDAITDTLDVMLENEELKLENDLLKEENEDLKVELASLRFELAFPNGLITESCILNNVNIVRDAVNAEGSVYAVRADGEGVEITINGGYYDAGSGSLYNIAVWAHHGSKVIINAGEFITGDDANGEANHCIYAAGGSIIEITGGLFKSTGKTDWLLNCQDNNGTIVITGGTFVGFNPADCISEGEHTSFVAEGYEVTVEAIDGINYYTVVKSIEEVEPTPDSTDETEQESPSEF